MECRSVVSSKSTGCFGTLSLSFFLFGDPNGAIACSKTASNSRNQFGGTGGVG